MAALGAIGHPDGRAAVLAGLDDKAPIRRRAVLALAPFEGPEVVTAEVTRNLDAGVQLIGPECAIPLQTSIENLKEIPRAVQDWTRERSANH